MKTLNNSPGRPDQTLGLVSKEAGASNDLLNLVRVGLGQGVRRRIDGEKVRRDHIDSHISALSREDSRDQ